MKKLINVAYLLVFLSLLMVLVVSNPAGVTVFDGQTTGTVSWLQSVPESTFGWCAPVAALMNYVFFGIGVVYLVKKKEWCLKGMMILGFGAACIAALPVVIQSDVKVVPSVMGLILLTAEGFAAYTELKKLEKEKQAAKPKGRKVKRR